MKKLPALLIVLLAFSALPARAELTEKHGAIGLGIVSAYTGLKLIGKSLGKDGTKRQFLVGASLFTFGSYTALLGPAHLHHWNNNNSALAHIRGEWNKATNEVRRAAAVRQLREQLDREPEENKWSIRGLEFLQYAIANDPTGALAKSFPWYLCIAPAHRASSSSQSFMDALRSMLS